MMEGKVKRALQLLTRSEDGQVLKPTEEIISKLKEKHPDRKVADPSVILPQASSTQATYHPIIFEKIDASLIHKTALQMDRTAGPSGLVTNAWKRLCSSFGLASNDLCAAIATTAKHLCSTYIDPSSISALVAGRLIALDKCPDLRPVLVRLSGA